MGLEIKGEQARVRREGKLQERFSRSVGCRFKASLTHTEGKGERETLSDASWDRAKRCWMMMDRGQVGPRWGWCWRRCGAAGLTGHHPPRALGTDRRL